MSEVQLAGSKWLRTELVGTGEFAELWVCEHSEDPRTKTYLRQIHLSEHAALNMSQLHEKLNRIVRHVAISEHLVNVENWEVQFPMCNIFLPYVSNEWQPLDIVTKHEILNENQMCGVIRDVMSGLSHLRKSHIFHGNVSLSNIVLNTDIERAKLTDFGQQRDFFKFNAAIKGQKETKGPVYTKIEKYVFACNNTDPAIIDYLQFGLALIDCVEKMSELMSSVAITEDTCRVTYILKKMEWDQNFTRQMYNFLNILMLQLPRNLVTFSKLDQFIPDPTLAPNLFSESSFSQNLKELSENHSQLL